MGTDPLRFESVIKIRDGNPYIPISPDQAAKIKPGWRKPLPVLVQINGQPDQPWRINLMPVGDGGFYLYLHGDVRKSSNTKVGDCVTVEVSFDPAYQSGPQHPMPSWFSAALDQDP
jgi:hypothetical protein